MSFAETLTREFIEKVYVEDKMSLKQISLLVGCDLTTVQNYMKKFGIPRRSLKESAEFTNYSHGNWQGNDVRSILTREFLEREYVSLNKSVHQIAEENGIKSSNSVTQYLKKFKLYRSHKKNSADFFTKEFLEEYYVRQNLSLKDVAMKAGKRSKYVVKRWLLYHGIPIRGVTINEKAKRGNKLRKDAMFSSSYWKGVLGGAKQRNIIVSISKEFAYNLFLEQNGKCAISGVDIILLWDTGHRTASLDRINSLGHYTEDNVQWVHRDINLMKMAMTDEELIKWCHIISSYQK